MLHSTQVWQENASKGAGIKEQISKWTCGRNAMLTWITLEWHLHYYTHVNSTWIIIVHVNDTYESEWRLKKESGLLFWCRATRIVGVSKQKDNCWCDGHVNWKDNYCHQYNVFHIMYSTKIVVTTNYMMYCKRVNASKKEKAISGPNNK